MRTPRRHDIAPRPLARAQEQTPRPPGAWEVQFDIEEDASAELERRRAEVASEVRQTPPDSYFFFENITGLEMAAPGAAREVLQVAGIDIFETGIDFLSQMATDENPNLPYEGGAYVIIALLSLVPERRAELRTAIEDLQQRYPENEELQEQLDWDPPETNRPDGNTVRNICENNIAVAMLCPEKFREGVPERIWEHGMEYVRHFYKDDEEEWLGVIVAANLRLLFPERRGQIPYTSTDIDRFLADEWACSEFMTTAEFPAALRILSADVAEIDESGNLVIIPRVDVIADHTLPDRRVA